MLYKLIVDIDKEALKEASELDDIESAIEQEMGWVEASGIYLDTMEEVK